MVFSAQRINIFLSVFVLANGTSNDVGVISYFDARGSTVTYPFIYWIGQCIKTVEFRIPYHQWRRQGVYRIFTLQKFTISDILYLAFTAFLGRDWLLHYQAQATSSVA